MVKNKKIASNFITFAKSPVGLIGVNTVIVKHAQKFLPHRNYQYILYNLQNKTNFNTVILVEYVIIHQYIHTKCITLRMQES